MESIKLIALYSYVCDKYNEELRWHCERFSNNTDVRGITDQELVTIYLFCMMYQEKYQLSSMHRYILGHWHSWFPELPSYQAFGDRMNRLSECFRALTFALHEDLRTGCDVPQVLLGDSMPIVMCSGRREGKVAPELTAKGYCASKKMHYFGVKLHVMALKSPGGLPLPKLTVVTSANEHDLEALRPYLEELYGIPAVLDKAYCDRNLAERMAGNGSCLVTPEKNKKGESKEERQFEAAYRKALGTAVAKVRQPIESFFAWIQAKTKIQDASKVRSTKGLLLHIFGRLAAVMLIMAGF